MKHLLKAESAYTGAMLWAMIALLAVTVAFASIRAGQAFQATKADVAQSQKAIRLNQKAIELNQKAIRFICSTEDVLDNLVVTAHQQIQASFKDGQYQRLLKQGILTKQNLVAARKTMRQYGHAHLKLESHANACQPR